MGPGPYQRFTETTLVSLEALEADIEASMKRSFFMAKEEAFSGMTSVAAPLSVPRGPVIGCLLATGTSGQLPVSSLEGAGAMVKKAAEMLRLMSSAVRALEPLLAGG